MGFCPHAFLVGFLGSPGWPLCETGRMLNLMILLSDPAAFCLRSAYDQEWSLHIQEQHTSIVPDVGAIQCGIGG